MTNRILIPAGRRDGRSFDNEQEFLNAMDAGNQVFTERNGVYFEVVADGSGVRYEAQSDRPTGI